MPKAKKAETAEKVVKEVKETKSVKKAEKPDKAIKTEATVKAEAPVKTEAPKAAKTSPSHRPTMEELLAGSHQTMCIPKKGDVVEGIVTDLSKKTLLVDISSKTEGIVRDREYDMAHDYIQRLSIGDKVPVYVLSDENDEGYVMLSLRKAIMDERWEQFEQAQKTDSAVTVYGVELNRGGMIVSLDGVRGFIPTSQFGKDVMNSLQSLLNEQIKVKVIEVDREKNRLIFSERFVSEAKQIAQKQNMLTAIKIGETYDGEVTGVMPFGIFVALDVPMEGEKEKGRIEGLVHVSELAWEKIEHPRDRYETNQKVKVKVLSVDSETGKINLSIKQLSDDPWKSVISDYPVGTVVNGRVSRLAQFGAFVNIAPGIDGLVHISKIPVGREPKVGDMIDVSIESIEEESRRIRLGMVLSELPVDYK
jgi:ribosomal protein S1